MRGETVSAAWNTGTIRMFPAPYGSANGGSTRILAVIPNPTSDSDSRLRSLYLSKALLFGPGELIRVGWSQPSFERCWVIK
jgi:hypothetical protein